MASFIPATTGQKLGICVPGIGIYFMEQYGEIQNNARDQSKTSVHALAIELIKPIIEQRQTMQSFSLEQRQEVISEVRTLYSCLLIHGLFSVITAVAIGALGGIIATVAAVAAGLYGAYFCAMACVNIYYTLNYPVPSPQPQTT